MRIVKLTEDTKKDILTNLLKRSPDNYGSYEETVKNIVNDIHSRRDAALFEYTEKFDHAKINADNVRVTEAEIEEAYTQVDAKLLETIRKAIVNIRTYHEKQKQYSWFDSENNGTLLGQKVTPLAKVGVYVPGGKAAYPSSVLMNVIPAKVAGVGKIVMTTPCNAEGKVYPTTLVAAKEAGVDGMDLTHLADEETGKQLFSEGDLLAIRLANSQIKTEGEFVQITELQSIAEEIRAKAVGMQPAVSFMEKCRIPIKEGKKMPAPRWEGTSVSVSMPWFS